MDFFNSIKSGFKNYIVFNGRVSRFEYNYWILFTILCSILLLIIDESTSLVGLFFLIIFVPSISIGVRRLHDLDRKGWHLLWYITYILLPVLLIYMMVKKGTDGKNSYGEDPLNPDTKAEDVALGNDSVKEEVDKVDEDIQVQLSEQGKTKQEIPNNKRIDLEPNQLQEQKPISDVEKLYDKFQHLKDEPKEFNFGKMLGLPFFTLMLAFDDDGDANEQAVIGDIMREVWGVPVFTTTEQADEMFNEIATWYNALNALPDSGSDEKYSIIKWAIASLKNPSGLLKETIIDAKLRTNEITTPSEIWAPKYFMKSLINIANANDKVTGNEKSFLIWCAEHLGYDIDFTNLTFTEIKRNKQKTETVTSQAVNETSVDDSSIETPTKPVESSVGPVEDFRSFLASKYPTLKIPNGKKIGRYRLGKGMMVNFRISKNGVTVLFYSGDKQSSHAIFQRLNQLGINGKKINNKYLLEPTLGVKNPNVVRMDIEIPYDGRDLNSDEMREEVYDVYSQFLELCKPLA
ncbi:MAG: DUF805 domain-containing protein [Candidatus Marinimicrobia bacterium]|jgi:uncharacterized membrane protein YhaH (DUF805 family)|nr:DUF805 domain-containing protein [Candidatus Neomarinimicrobiota bacterium]